MVRIRMPKTGLCGVSLAVGLAIAGSLAAETPVRSFTVHIKSADYGPLPTGLKVGDTITWFNDDTVAHTVTARNHSFDLHLNPGQSAKLTMQKDGTFPIFASTTRPCGGC